MSSVYQNRFPYAFPWVALITVEQAQVATGEILTRAATNIASSFALTSDAPPRRDYEGNTYYLWASESTHKLLVGTDIGIQWMRTSKDPDDF